MAPVMMNLRVAVCLPDHTWTEHTLLNVPVDYNYPDEPSNKVEAELEAIAEQFAPEQEAGLIVTLAIIESWPA